MFILIMVPAISFLILAGFWNYETVQLPAGLTKWLIRIHFILLPIAILALVLAIQEIYFTGYYTSKIIAWTFLLTGLLTLPFGNRNSFRTWIKIYFTGLLGLYASFAVFVFVPFIGTIVGIGIFEKMLISQKIYYEDFRIRVQDNHNGPLDAASGPYVFVKQGILEWQTGPCFCYVRGIDEPEINRTEDTVSISVHHNDKYFSNPFVMRINIEDGGFITTPFINNPSEP